MAFKSYMKKSDATYFDKRITKSVNNLDISVKRGKTGYGKTINVKLRNLQTFCGASQSYFLKHCTSRDTIITVSVLLFGMNYER